MSGVLKTRVSHKNMTSYFYLFPLALHETENHFLHDIGMAGKFNPLFYQKNKIVIFRLKNPYMDANLGKNHKYLFIIIITIKSCFAGSGGLGGRVGRDVNQLAKPAFRSQCAHTEHSEGPIDTVLSTSSFLEW